jgi:regulator of PEP synthase PpsR (kinase-PPPase family)
VRREKAMGGRKRINVFIVSDGTGTTAESVLASVVVQFRGVQFNIRRFPFARTEEQMKDIVEQAPEGKCIIVFTLVSEKVREFLIEQGRAKKLTVVDVMGPLLTTFSSILKHSPRMRPGIFRHNEEEMYLLTGAIHFTLSHDDGMGLETIEQADLIILGVSRTGKTPTSIFLSCRKLKVANVPIIHQVPLSPSVSKAPAKKVGFTMSAERLVQLRSERVRRMPSANLPKYASKAHVLEELEYCRRVFRRIPSLRVIDVTDRSIEEISEWITRQVL